MFVLSSSSGPGCHPLTVEIAGSNPAGSAINTFMFIIVLCQKEDQHLLVHHLDRTDLNDLVRKGRVQDHKDRFKAVLRDLHDLVQVEHQPVRVRLWELVLLCDHVRKDLVRLEGCNREIKDKSLQTI